jgi:molecular chaperone DnaJ
MATQRDYYEVLSIERTAGGEEIKRAYRKMAMKFHPDRNPGDKDAEAKFKEAAEAYEVLTDPQKRQLYDRHGHAGLRGQGMHDFGRMDFGDIFSMFEDIFGGRGFGGGGGGGRRPRGAGPRPRRGYDLETEIDIDMADVATGCHRDVEFTRMDSCATCHGTGGKPGTDPVTCVTCAGRGFVEQAGLGGMFRMRTTCPVCQGAGKTYREKCPECNGTGQTPKRRKLSVKVPQGIHDGQAVRVPGEGEPGADGGLRGDLHVVVRVTPHAVLERENDHLVLKMPISFTQAALGATVEVPSLEGNEKLTIKPGTQHGEIIRVQGKGLPNLRTGRRGDYVAIVLIEVPKKLTAKQETLLREYAETENHDVMPHNKSFWKKIKETLTALI